MADARTALVGLGGVAALAFLALILLPGGEAPPPEPLEPVAGDVFDDEPASSSGACTQDAVVTALEAVKLQMVRYGTELAALERGTGKRDETSTALPGSQSSESSAFNTLRRSRSAPNPTTAPRLGPIRTELTTRMRQIATETLNVHRSVTVPECISADVRSLGRAMIGVAEAYTDGFYWSDRYEPQEVRRLQREDKERRIPVAYDNAKAAWAKLDTERPKIWLAFSALQKQAGG